MIGNRAINVSLVKTPSTGTDATVSQPSGISLDKAGQIAAIAQCTVETAGKTFALAYLTKKLVDTACEIAIIVAKSKL